MNVSSKNSVCSLQYFAQRAAMKKKEFHRAWHYQSQLPVMGKIKTLMGVRGIMPSARATVWSCDEFSHRLGVEWGGFDLKIWGLR